MVSRQKTSGLLPGLVLLLAACSASAADKGLPGSAELIGIARLPGDVFVPGPVSGQFLDTADTEA